MIHELKIRPHYYLPVKEGRKTFEVRVNDRGFQAGDEVILREYSDEPCIHDPSVKIMYTGSQNLHFKIGYVLQLDDGRVVFSLLPKDNE